MILILYLITFFQVNCQEIHPEKLKLHELPCDEFILEDIPCEQDAVESTETDPTIPDDICFDFVQVNFQDIQSECCLNLHDPPYEQDSVKSTETDLILVDPPNGFSEDNKIEKQFSFALNMVFFCLVGLFIHFSDRIRTGT